MTPMATRSIFANAKRTTIWRSLTSRASHVNSLTKPSTTNTKHVDLATNIFRLKFPRRSATAVIESWVESGHKVCISELRSISRTLLKTKRHKHALEILTWMEKQYSFRMSAADHAVRLELIIKVHDLKEAEEYFTCIPDRASQKAASLPLLHGYVKERAVDKAEAFMTKLSGLGLIVSCHPCNEMMKLYIATSHYNKVLLVIQQMKQNKIPRNVLSYNLWMNACAEISGVTSVEMVYKEMLSDRNVEVGWSSVSTLANVYMKEGIINKALLVLKSAEKKLSTCNRHGYFFIMTLYASLNNKNGIFRLWEASKAVGGRITCANYMCILSCFVKLGDLVEAKRIFVEWESNCLKYDVRVSNILLGAYMRNGLIKDAESLHLHTLERGGCPNYKTWEILMEGWVKSGNMSQAIDAMKKGFALLRHCDWRPSEGIVLAIAEYYEKHGNFEDANQFIRDIHQLGLGSLPLYKSSLRMHVIAQKPAFDILEMMEKDKIMMDDNTSALVNAINV